MPALPVALQMYTVRDDAAKDFAGTIRAVARIGYPAVELAGTGGLSARDLKALLEDNNLGVAGSHIGLAALENDLQSVIDYNTELGNRYIVCPALPGDRREGAENYRRVADLLNKIGGNLKGAGLQLAYHNHAFEFVKYDGEYAYDILMMATDPELVKIEMDTYWVKKGGEDPAAYLRKYAGRVPLIHLKDMTPGDDGTFAEVGEGIMDFRSIFDAAEIAGGEYYIVEQDRCRRPALESAKLSFENLRGMGIA